MHRLEIPVKANAGQKIEVQLCNGALAVSTLTITTEGGTIIKVPLAAFAELTMTAGHDAAAIQFLVSIEGAPESADLHLVPKEQPWQNQ